jgi:arylsulfatase A-like enzyme
MRPGRLCAGAALALAACGSRADDPRPNVLLISLDSVRADFVGAYGARLPHADGRSPTPNLDRLAAEGVLYENARSTTSWTLPAHASLLTGELELVHGLEQDGERLPEDLPTLAETLGAAGFRTYGVYSGPYLDPRHGFARGFERYEAGYGPELTRAVDEAVVAEAQLASLDPQAEPERVKVALQRHGTATRELELASHRDVSSERVTELALAELARAAEDERPFFLFAHFFDPHYDYAAPEPFTRAFDPGYAGALDGRDFFTNPAVAAFDETSPTGRRQVASAREVEHLEALYAGEIAWTDAQVGKLLRALDALELAASTLVIVVGDHGDEFFEHGSIGHRQTLCEEVLRVPLLFRWPGRLTPRREAWPIELAAVRDKLLGLLRPPGRGVDPGSRVPAVGRLVRPELATLDYPFDGQPARADAVRLRILECYWDGSLKLRRERSLWSATEVLEPPQRTAFEAAAAAELAREELAWIDLAANPEESESAWSRDFSGARAREALERFRRDYARLAGARRTPPVAEESGELLAALRGLGYAGQEARIGTLASDALVLPPPGSN